MLKIFCNGLAALYGSIKTSWFVGIEGIDYYNDKYSPDILLAGYNEDLYQQSYQLNNRA